MLGWAGMVFNKMMKILSLSSLDVAEELSCGIQVNVYEQVCYTLF
ncbi:hypothetical protein MITS9504_00604 [Synechococcus sp. MIT S9504]|nr:hypothetical protein MITS9504_00604 [Synechococcus sp. MIT S9504]